MILTNEQTQKKISIIKSSAENGVITFSHALKLIDRLYLISIKEDVLEWGRYYFPHKFYTDFCYGLHQYLVDIKEEPITSTLAPRDHAKTTIICFLIIIYLALNKPKKYCHFMNVQSTSSKAIAINLSIRDEIESNELILRDYGDLKSSDKWTEKQFVLKNGCIFTAIGAGESMRGVNYRNIRPDFFAVDDLYDEDDIHSQDRIKKKNDWIWSALYPARNSRKVCPFHFLGTAINKNDIMHSLSRKKGVVFRKFQAIIDYDKKTTLWKPYDELVRDKELMGSVIFNRELQNEPRDDETSIIKEAWIQYYNGIIPIGEVVRRRIIAIDPAISEKQTADSTGKVLVIETKNGNYYVQEAKNDKLSFDKNLTDIISWHDREKPDIVKVEAISAFQAFTQELSRRSSMPLKTITSVKDKISRLEAQSAKFENKKVFINSHIPKIILDEFIEQLINNKPNHDDIRDALILALEDNAPRTSIIF